LLPEVSSFYAELGQNLALFAKFKQLAESPGFEELSPARRRIIENDLRDFRLSGAELPEEKKPRFKEIQEELSALGAKFSENLLDATNAHAEWITDEAGLAGLPDDVKEAARAAAAKDETLPNAPAGNLPCTRRPTCRCCSSATTATCASACTAPMPRAPRSSARPVGQRAADRQDPRAARRRGADARLRQLCRGVAGDQDGRHADPGRRLPA
jgi:hypothetical protein